MAGEALSVTDEGHWAVEAQTIPVKSEEEARPMKCPDEIGVMGKYPS